MSTAILVLGNQLFPVNEYKQLKSKKILMIEDAGLCTHYKYHKHKIIFFLASMQKYRDELKKNKFEVSYYDGSHKLFNKAYEDKLLDYIKSNKDVTEFQSFEVEDKFFEKRLNEFFKKHKIKWTQHKSPMFLCTRADFKDYLGKYKKPFMKNFYEQQRKSFKILLNKNGTPKDGKWSFDDENRKRMPKGESPLPILKIKNDQINQGVCNFVDKNFADHPGASEDFWLPTTRQESLKWLEHFIDKKLVKFGAYQDALTSDSDFVYHSVLAPMINIGFILPSEIIEAIENAYAKNSKAAPINSVEGFIRQVLGWREFIRGIYQNFGDQQFEKNFFKHKNKLTKHWYIGDTGIPILDDCIKKTSKYGYSHHIERLMVLSNFMLLCEVHPHEVYKWFMEMHCDSSDWVMGPNVFGMGQFSDGGIFATKPYTCGSNYLLKMSDYKKGDWCDIADGLYWRFIDRNKDFYRSNPRMSMMTKSLEKMDATKKKRIFKAANDFIIKVTE